MDLVPAEWDEGLASVCEMGANKYAPWAWAKNPMESWRMQASALRHIAKWRKGERVDEESGLDHRLHAAWNLLADWYYDLYNMREDNGHVGEVEGKLPKDGS